MNARLPLRLILLVLSSLLALGLAEAMASFVLYAPLASTLVPRRATHRLQKVYMDWTRHIVQFEPACAQFDQQLFYVLRPGECRFRNLEYDTTIRINSAGFRDDEEALESPDVAVLGDSFAMGWGVDVSDTFARVLAQRTGLKVLNTGVSSYGTVREKIGLTRVRSDHLKYLVIQYCPNDKDENLLFYLRGNTNRTLSEDQFERVLRWYHDNRSYYPGRSLDLLSSHRIFGRLLGYGAESTVLFEDSWTEADREAQAKLPPLTEAEAFVNALVHAGRPLPESLRKIIVFSVNSRSVANQDMIDDLQTMKAAHRLDDVHAEIVILRASDFITPEHYYLMDDHLKPTGHAAIANAVAAQLKAREIR
jgi:hypothetical protein